MENEKLYIPYGLSIEQEYFPGFGRTEMKHFLIGFIGFAAAGALLLIISGQLLALIVMLIIGAAGCLMMTRKDPFSRVSVIGQVTNIIRFTKSQKRYRYIYKSPWESN